jgi:hypothetical protein
MHTNELRRETVSLTRHMHELHDPRGDVGSRIEGRIGFDAGRRRPVAAHATGLKRVGAVTAGYLHVPLFASGIRDDRGFLVNVVDICWHFVWPLCAKRTISDHS